MSTQPNCPCQHPIELPPAFVPTVEALADAMRAHHGNCTEDVLQGLGFPLNFQKAHQDEAVALANKGFVRQSEAIGRRSLEEERALAMAKREALATQIIHEHMPGTIYLVAELQARGFSTTEIDHVLPRARARAALAFARTGAH